MTNHGFIATPTMGDIARLHNRIVALETVLSELLCALHDDGTLEDEELSELQDRLG
jgi:hypothetical protein